MPGDLNICYTCPSLPKTPYFYRLKCYSECPFNTYLYNNVCYNCKDYNQYFVTGELQCRDKCPDDKLAYDSNNICYSSCRENGFKLMFGKCESKCAANTIWNEDNGECDSGFANIRNCFT